MKQRRVAAGWVVSLLLIALGAAIVAGAASGITLPGRRRSVSRRPKPWCGVRGRGRSGR